MAPTIDWNTKRRQTAIFNTITKGVEQYNAEPLMGPAAVVIYVDGYIHVQGHSALANFIRAHKDEIESQPEFIRPAVLKLPSPPVMNRRFGFKKARRFLNRWLPGPRPGYGRDDTRPTWWNTKWASINNDSFNRKELILLIVAMYQHYGTSIDMNTVHLQDSDEEADEEVPDSPPVLVADAVFPVATETPPESDDTQEIQSPATPMAWTDDAVHPDHPIDAPGPSSTDNSDAVHPDDHVDGPGHSSADSPDDALERSPILQRKTDYLRQKLKGIGKKSHKTTEKKSRKK